MQALVRNLVLRSLVVLVFLTLAPFVCAEILIGKSIGVVNGDAIRMDVDGKPVLVRLDGIDAPEMGQHHGVSARRQLSHRVTGKRLSVKVIDRTADDSVTGIVTPHGESQDINTAMVASGFAWKQEVGTSNLTTLRHLEAEARERKLGLWKHPSPIPPWEWRALCKTDQRQIIAKYENVREQHLTDKGTGFQRVEFDLGFREEISGPQLRATLIKAAAAVIEAHPDIDAIAINALVIHSGSFLETGLRLEWCLGGNWNDTSALIAKSNDRSEYKYAFKGVNGYWRTIAEMTYDERKAVYTRFEADLDADIARGEKQFGPNPYAPDHVEEFLAYVDDLHNQTNKKYTALFGLPKTELTLLLLEADRLGWSKNTPPPKVGRSLNERQIRGDAKKVFVTVDSDTHERLMKLVVAEDKVGMLEMVEAGKVFMVSGNVRVRVIDWGGFFGLTELRVLEGEHSGRVGFTMTENIK